MNSYGAHCHFERSEKSLSRAQGEILPVNPEQISPVGRNDSGSQSIFFYCGIQVKLLFYFQLESHFGWQEEDQLNFAYAAYNLGPTKVQQLRQKAKKMGLDKNRWFYHVEQAALRFVGQEPVRYVANIHKYYIAYKLVNDAQTQKSMEIKALKK